MTNLEHEDPQRGGVAVLLEGPLEVVEAEELLHGEHEPDAVAQDEEERDGEEDVGLAGLHRLDLEVPEGGRQETLSQE